MSAAKTISFTTRGLFMMMFALSIIHLEYILDQYYFPVWIKKLLLKCVLMMAAFHLEKGPAAVHIYSLGSFTEAPKGTLSSFVSIVPPLRFILCQVKKVYTDYQILNF